MSYPSDAIHNQSQKALFFPGSFASEQNVEGPGSGERRKRDIFLRSSVFWVRVDLNNEAAHLHLLLACLLTFSDTVAFRGSRLSCDGSWVLKCSRPSLGLSSHALDFGCQGGGRRRSSARDPTGRRVGLRVTIFLGSHPASLEPSWARAWLLRPRPAIGRCLINLTAGISRMSNMGKTGGAGRGSG